MKRETKTRDGNSLAMTLLDCLHLFPLSVEMQYADRFVLESKACDACLQNEVAVTGAIFNNESAVISFNFRFGVTYADGMCR